MTTSTSHNPFFGMAERPFTVRFSKPDSADRLELIRFISNTFHHDYGVKIKSLKLYLMSLRDQDDKLIAACSLRSAAIEKLHLESFLQLPIETVLAERVGVPIERGNIIEIDNFTVASLDMARYLVAAINDQLHFTAKLWAVFTTVSSVSDEFVKMGMRPIVLADADKNRLAVAEQKEWGTFFEQNPQVIAIRRLERRNNPRSN